MGTKDQELRTKIKQENDKWSNSEIMAHLGELWRDMKDEDKSHYVELAKEAKISRVSNTKLTEPVVPVVTRPKKAKSPYFQYLYDPDIREPLQAANPDWKPKQLTTSLAEQWNKLSD